MAAIFIVSLPAGKTGVFAIAARHLFDDARRLAPPGFGRKGIMAAGAEALGPSIDVIGGNVRVLVHQPLGWGGRGRAEHNLEACRVKYIHGAVEPFKGEAVTFRLQPRPGKLANAHIPDAHLDHACGVLCPPAFGPMFGIIADTKHSILHAITFARSVMIFSDVQCMSFTEPSHDDRSVKLQN